jgi:predicted  nucleic acid-binding Zn-ribbon protein
MIKRIQEVQQEIAGLNAKIKSNNDLVDNVKEEYAEQLVLENSELAGKRENLEKTLSSLISEYAQNQEELEAVKSSTVEINDVVAENFSVKKKSYHFSAQTLSGKKVEKTITVEEAQEGIIEEHTQRYLKALTSKDFSGYNT